MSLLLLFPMYPIFLKLSDTAHVSNREEAGRRRLRILRGRRVRGLESWGFNLGLNRLTSTEWVFSFLFFFFSFPSLSHIYKKEIGQSLLQGGVGLIWVFGYGCLGRYESFFFHLLFSWFEKEKKMLSGEKNRLCSAQAGKVATMMAEVYLHVLDFQQVQTTA